MLLRIWDIFFYEGSITLFKATLGMIKSKVNTFYIASFIVTLLIFNVIIFIIVLLFLLYYLIYLDLIFYLSLS